MDNPPDRLRITHRSVCRYVQPVTFLPHRLVVRPREGPDRRVEQLALNISPRSDIAWSCDPFGSSIVVAHVVEPADVLQIESDVTVRRFPPSTSPPVPTPVAVA